MQIFALANICRNRINYKLEITRLMGFHAIAVDRAIGFLSDRHHRTVSAWKNPLYFSTYLTYSSFSTLISHPLPFFFPEPSEQSLCPHVCSAISWWGNTCIGVPPAQWGSPHWHSPGTITTLSSWPVNVQMWKRCVREGFKCGSCTEGSWPTQNKAQQPSRINEKPSQLMLFASMIPSKNSVLAVKYF